jgi:K+-sensing histidine kinase KdpD
LVAGGEFSIRTRFEQRGYTGSGRNIADAVASVVKNKYITQVIFGRSAVKGFHRLFYLSAVHRFLREAPSVDVHIVTHGEDTPN